MRTIAFTDLVVEDRPLASGAFKSVYKASWARPGEGDAQQVAVLVLRQGGSAASEIKVFEKLGRHPHLVKLLAVSARPPAGDMCMVLEFAQRGSLDGVLNELSNNGESPTHAVLLTAASQVCAVCAPVLPRLLCMPLCHMECIMCVCVWSRQSVTNLRRPVAFMHARYASECAHTCCCICRSPCVHAGVRAGVMPASYTIY